MKIKTAVFYVLCLLAALPARSAEVSAAEKQLENITAALSASLLKMDAGLAAAAKELSAPEFNSDTAAAALDKLCASVPGSYDCAAVSSAGKMVKVRPAKYAKFEGSDISGQPQVTFVRDNNKPVLSMLFKSVEGLDSIDFEYPVYNPNGEFKGSVSLLFLPKDLLGAAVSAVQGGTVRIFQEDGAVIFSTEPSEIGNTLLGSSTGPLAELAYTAGMIVSPAKGFLSAEYQLDKNGPRRPVRVYWDTVEAQGVKWKITFAENAAKAK